jgi:cell division protein FtsW
MKEAGIEVRVAPRRYDSLILVATFTLVSLGALMVYSASTSMSLLVRQVMFSLVGLVGLAVGATVPYRIWRRLAPVGFAISILLLVALRLVGISSHGAQRWFQFGGFDLQPSELAKIALAIYFAVWLSNKGENGKIKSLRECTVPFGIMLAAICVLVILQPDLGTAIVIACSMVIVFFVGGARLDHLGLGIACGFLLAVPAVSFESYRNARLKVWLNPWEYASGLGFQTVHALEALGAGGILGRGLGNSAQKGVLPAAFTDSIFAVMGEELGLVGTVTVVLLFLLLAWRGFTIARHAPDQFGRLLAVGITATIAIQAILNIAVITNSVPFTGVPLPFISYGGSSLVVSLFSVGVLLNISREASRSFGWSEPQAPGGGRRRDEDRDNRREDRWPRIPRSGRRRGPAPLPAGIRIIELWGRGDRQPRYG